MADDVVLCRLTLRSRSPKEGDLTRPKIFNILGSDIKDLKRNFGAGGSVFQFNWKQNGQSKAEVYENPSQVRLNINLTNGVTGGLYDSDKNLGVAGAGTDLAGATQLAAYFNKVSAVTATTADGVKLLASPSIGDVVVVLNNASAAVDCFPNTATSKIDSLAVSAVKSVPVGESIHFVCKTGGASAVWNSAQDENNA